MYACDTDNVLTIDTSDKIPKTDTMKLQITIGNKLATAILYDNPTAKDFASLLPLSLKLEDYNNTEKISNLSKKLSTQSAPAGFDPSTGDITYYAPWGNIALFYKDFSYSSGLISLGKITDGIDAFKVTGPVTIKIELKP
jgi:hypothetical protein